MGKKRNLGWTIVRQFKAFTDYPLRLRHMVRIENKGDYLKFTFVDVYGQEHSDTCELDGTLT